jgi:hypothetical protein
MADQPGVQFFVDPELIGRCSEDILQCALGDALFLRLDMSNGPFLRCRGCK